MTLPAWDFLLEIILKDLINNFFFFWNCLLKIDRSHIFLIFEIVSLSREKLTLVILIKMRWSLLKLSKPLNIMALYKLNIIMMFNTLVQFDNDYEWSDIKKSGVNIY